DQPPHAQSSREAVTTTLGHRPPSQCPQRPVSSTLSSCRWICTGRRWYAPRRGGGVAVPKNGLRVVHSDIHLIEPPDLWARYIDATLKHQAPRGFGDWVLDLRVEIDGKLMPADVTYSAEAYGRSTHRDRERFRSFHERGWSAEAQLEAMDEEGIDV